MAKTPKIEYIRQDDRYWIAVQLNDGPVQWREVEGSAVENEYGLDLFLHRRETTIRGCRSSWVVSEGITGMSVGWGTTPKKAVAATLKKIRAKREAGVNVTDRIDRVTEAPAAISPRWKRVLRE